jgi:hypothetical protein
MHAPTPTLIIKVLVMKKLLVAIAMALAAGVSNANIISVDWQSSGDGLLTRDTTSNLEWLDLTQTYNQTVASILPLTSAGQAYEGFRLALASEVHALMAAAGLPVSSATGTISSNASDLAAADALTLLLGETVGQYFGSSYYGSRGHLDDGGIDRVVGYYTINDTSLFNDYFSGAPTWPGAGVWLVRDSQTNAVPEPAALCLLGIGLAGFVFSRRRNKA